MEKRKISFIGWNSGIKEYENLGSKHSFFATTEFLEAAKREYVSIIGYSIKFPNEGWWKFLKYEEADVVMLLPIHIIHKQLDILCDISRYSDYCLGIDLCASNKIIEYLKEIFAYLREKGFGTRILHADGWSAEYILNEFKVVCTENFGVGINISNGYEAWKGALKKSAKQNQRTAYNRMKTDEKVLEIKHFYGGLSWYCAYQQCYLHRSRNVERRAGLCPNYLRPVISVLALVDTFDKWNTMIRKLNDSYSCMCFIDGKLAAYVSGLVHNRCFIIPYLSYNSEFRRYDPGRVLIDKSIEYLCKEDLADFYDLYKGTEQYKIDNGGVLTASSILWFSMTIGWVNK